MYTRHSCRISIHNNKKTFFFSVERRDTAISLTSNTTTSCDSKTIDNNALGNFVRVQELIQKHFDIPLVSLKKWSF